MQAGCKSFNFLYAYFAAKAMLRYLVTNITFNVQYVRTHLIWHLVHSCFSLLILFKMMDIWYSCRLIGTLCAISTRAKVARIIQHGKKALMTHFVPRHIGFAATSREDLIKFHTSHIAVSLFSDFNATSAILILDGTYLYIQKSAKNKIQRKCFSMHKYRPLIKPMVITSTTGRILSIVGPFYADGKNNDAAITKHMFMTNSDNIKSWLKEGDIFILDRGFRDALPFLSECGIRTESPSFLPKSSKQMSTEDANHSRLVTKIRWAVESINGRIKSWKYFDKVIPNIDIPNTQDFLLIVAALCNAYRPALRSNNENDKKVAEKMLSLSKQQNLVQKRVTDDKLLAHRSSWSLLQDNNLAIPEFPKLSEDDIRSLTFGVYQVRQAALYIDEYLDGGNSNIYISKVYHNLLHARIQSRHTSAKQHNLWIEFDENDVTGWYCQCPAGARTVGTCSHIAGIIWYLSYARHHDYSPNVDKIGPVLMDAASSLKK